MSYVNKKPKRFEVHLYVSRDRFNNENWKYDVGEELYILGKMMMEGLAVIPARIKDVGGNIGEVNIDYEEEDPPPQGVLGKPHKVDLNLCFDNAAFDDNWRHEFANILMDLAKSIKLNNDVPDGIKDTNGNTVGDINVIP